MSFNVEDPLAGILSDGSDDSFFDDDILGKKRTPKKKPTPTAISIEKKNALFHLGDEDTDKIKSVSTTAEKKDSLLQLDSKKSPVPFKRTLSKESVKVPSQTDIKVNKSGFDRLDLSKSPGKSKVSSSADKLDILSDLGGPSKEPTKSINKGKSSQSLLDDILGGSSVKTGSSNQGRPVTAGKSQEFDFDSILGKNEPKMSASNKSLPQKQTVKESVKEEKEITKKSKPTADWLGIFQDKEEEDENFEDTGMPSWLGGGDSKKKKAEEKKAVTKSDSIKEKSAAVPKVEISEQEHQKEQVKANLEQGIEQVMKSIPTPTINTSVIHGSNEDITSEGAALYLQQQESQLMVALQLKAQEERLAAMQMRQKESQRVQREAANAQQAQLDAMLRRQAENRLQMQSIIATHQERITQRIRDLLGTEYTEVEDQTLGNDDNVTVGERRETPHSRERKQLLQLVQSLQENHDKEIDLMETSYRRQLAFLEVSLNQSEERMKEESDKLVKFYTEKINWLEEHHALYKKLTDENVQELTERHKAENEMLRHQHLENIRVLQEHHAALMENVKNAVKQEQTLIQDSAGFSTDLKELITNMRENRNQCQELVEKVQMLTENSERKSDGSIQFRETQINDMIQQLKKERENFELEKSENRETIKMLEIRLKQMTSMIEEEAANLKQKRMEFEFEKATFNKQTEFAKNILKKQDEEMKILREDIQKEYQEKISKINEEKAKAVKDSAALARDKSSIQSLKQELEKMKAELQAELEEVTEERSKLNVEKQQIHMEEQRVLAKSRDLDLLAKTAIEKQSQAEKKYSEAEFIQRKYEERIRRIQEHVVSLNSREKQIAREKVALSRERLALHNERKQVDTRQQCSLCRSTQNAPQYYETNYPLIDPYINPTVTTNRDYIPSNAANAMSTIEQEMAHLLGRNLSLRHSTGIENHSREDRLDEGQNQFQTDSTTLETGPFKDYLDPKFMMLRLDVKKVLSNLEQSKKEDTDHIDVPPEDDAHED